MKTFPPSEKQNIALISHFTSSLEWLDWGELEMAGNASLEIGLEY